MTALAAAPRAPLNRCSVERINGRLKTMWGEALNPNSHWYQAGIEVLGSPTQRFFVADNRANATS
jgi:hypothetical protein